MELKDILAISGKSGLFKSIAQNKSNIIVESLIDKKRFPVYASDRVSALEEISIFTNDEDLPLHDALKMIFEKLDGEKALDHKSDNQEIKTFFAEAIPDYNQEQVYVSDMKKIIHWYNQLHDIGLLDFPDEPEEKVEGDPDSNIEDKPKEEIKE